jgi:hypothetical protein
VLNFFHVSGKHSSVSDGLTDGAHIYGSNAKPNFLVSAIYVCFTSNLLPVVYDACCGTAVLRVDQTHVAVLAFDWFDYYH